MLSLAVCVANIFLFLINSYAGAVMLILTTMSYLFVTNQKFVDKLFHCIVYSAPFYPFSFYGARERLSLCTIYIIIFCVYILLTCVKNRKIKIRKKDILFLVGVFVACIGYFLSITMSLAIEQALWDTYHSIVILLALVFTRIAVQNRILNINIDQEIVTFVHGSLAFAIGLYGQYILYTVFGVSLGYIFVSDSTRFIFNLYVYAKSVVSMYLAVGMVYYFIRLFDKRLAVSSLILFIFMTGALLINNTRTGLICFFVAGVLYTATNFRRVVKRIRIMIMLLLVALASILLIEYMLTTRAKLTGILDDNGRFELIEQAFQLLHKYIFVGIGGAAVDYYAISFEMVPHIFAVQAIIQYGLISGIAMCFVVYSNMVRARGEIKYLVIVVLCGSMLFANWQNGVFVIPLLMIAEVSKSSWVSVRGVETRKNLLR